MEHKSRTALLIDTDNVSTDVVAQVLEHLQTRKHMLQHRRAYGSVQKMNEFAELAKDHAIRLLPSTFAGPNATDLVLAIDAVELVLRQPVDEVVLVSSDRDYAPLIVRLRELGCRVTGFGQEGKSAKDIERDYLRVYDAFEIISPRKTRTAIKAKAKPAAKGSAPAAPHQAKAKPADTAAPAAKSKRQAVAKPALAAVVASMPDTVAQVLESCPELRHGQNVRLNVVGKKLHDSGVLKKNAKPSTLLKKHSAYFEMLPLDKPETVRYLGRH
ncbi:MAG: NYN domain-containing protein [Burkholderiaceae bacterium]